MISGISKEAICAVQAYHRAVLERQRQRQRHEAALASDGSRPGAAGLQGHEPGSQAASSEATAGTEGRTVSVGMPQPAAR